MLNNEKVINKVSEIANEKVVNNLEEQRLTTGENNNLHIGIDVGSTTVKLAILDVVMFIKNGQFNRG